jgi:hypothetical protein
MTRATTPERAYTQAKAVAIPITVRCECGETHAVELGDRVDCSCGRQYDTSTLAPERFAHIRARQARMRLYLQLGVVFVVTIAVVTAVVWGVKGIALGLPLSALIWFLFLGKWYRKRWLLDVGEPTTLQLEASNK